MQFSHQIKSRMKYDISLITYITNFMCSLKCSFRFKYCFWYLQEAYSVARQFNLIPPIAEQAEYNLFQREKVELQMPELYHKIGKWSLISW